MSCEYPSTTYATGMEGHSQVCVCVCVNEKADYVMCVHAICIFCQLPSARLLILAPRFQTSPRISLRFVLLSVADVGFCQREGVVQIIKNVE